MKILPKFKFVFLFWVLFLSKMIYSHSPSLLLLFLKDNLFVTNWKYIHTQYFVWFLTINVLRIKFSATFCASKQISEIYGFVCCELLMNVQKLIPCRTWEKPEKTHMRKISIESAILPVQFIYGYLLLCTVYC